MNNENSFTNFVADRRYQQIDAELRESFEKEEEKKLKTVSVRLSPDVLQTVDNIAEKLEISRQLLLQEMIDGGISFALQSLADTENRCRSGREDMTEEQLIERGKEIYMEMIRELVA